MEESKKKTKRQRKKKKEKEKLSKKNLIIIILSIVIVILLGIIGYFVYRHSLENKTTGSEWTDKYYEFLKEQSKAEKVNQSLKEKSEISFVQTKSMDDPMMVVRNDSKCDKNDCKTVNIFGIVDNSVKFLTSYSADIAEVKLYYNINKKEYKYYIHTANEGFEGYTSLDTVKYDYDNYNVVKAMEERGLTDYSSDEYKQLSQELYEKREKDTTREHIEYFGDDRKVTQKTLDGKTIEYDKAASELVDTDVKPEYFTYKKSMDTIKLREEVIEGKDEYKELNDLLTKAIEKVVKEQIELIEKTQQDIEKAKADIKADEERKAKEAEAAEYAKGLTVGSQHLKYGTYTTSVPEGGVDGVPLYGTITLKPKGVFHIKTNFEQSSGDLRNIDEDGTYTVGTAINSFSTQDAIKFTTNSGYKFTYFVTNSSYFNSQWIMYNYSGS